MFENVEEYVKSLPEENQKEVMSLIDKERTKASKSATENARAKFLQDESIYKELEPKFKEKFEKEAQMSAEDKYAQREKELEERTNKLQFDENSILVKKTFVEKGLNDDYFEKSKDFIVSSNKEQTKTNLDKFFSILDPMANEMAGKQIKEKLNTFPGSSTGDKAFTTDKGNVVGLDQLKAELQQAVETNDARRQIDIMTKMQELK